MAITKRSLVPLLVLALGAIAVLGWSQPRVVADEVPPPARDGVFVHVSHGADDAHRALMALKMAALMTKTQDVLVYMDVQAVHLAVKADETGRHVTVATHEAFPASDEMLRQILAGGGTVCVCPTCLKAAGYEEADLREWIALADKAKFFSFTKGRILSIDY
jgi:predicted peroxiredoxin